MSDKKNQANRIPYETIEQLDRWPLPEVGGNSRVFAEKKAAAGPRPNERVEDVVEPVQHKPLTAEQLNQITEEAEKEGYAAGFEQGTQKGLEEGRARGEEQGRQQAYEETRAVLEDERNRLASICGALLEPLDEQDGALENILVDMAVGLAKHLLHRELAADPGALYEVVHRAVEALPMGAGNLRIFLNPEDVPMAEKLFSGRGSGWEFFADEHLHRGGCRVQSAESLVDYSVERRLREYLETIAHRGPVDPAQVTPVTDYRSEAEEPGAGDE